MSIFGSIMSKIFHAGAATVENTIDKVVQPSSTQPAATASPQAAPSGSPSAPEAAAPLPPSAPAQAVDVGEVLTQMASQKGGGGNWKTSIVDLLKLLDLDSSLDARKALANELSVHVGADGSAEENIALHKAVMQKLEENGGKVPADLKA